jgi:hypothetical protein
VLLRTGNTVIHRILRTGEAIYQCGDPLRRGARRQRGPPIPPPFTMMLCLCFLCLCFLCLLISLPECRALGPIPAIAPTAPLAPLAGAGGLLKHLGAVRMSYVVCHHMSYVICRMSYVVECESSYKPRSYTHTTPHNTTPHHTTPHTTTPHHTTERAWLCKLLKGSLPAGHIDDVCGGGAVGDVCRSCR